MSPLPSCPTCGSGLVQPLRWQQRQGGDLLVELRCPECFVVVQICHTSEEMAALDRSQAASREVLVAAYERAVAENMAALADAFREGLARDLVTADDFAPRGRRASLPRAA